MLNNTYLKLRLLHTDTNFNSELYIKYVNLRSVPFDSYFNWATGKHLTYHM